MTMEPLDFFNDNQLNPSSDARRPSVSHEGSDSFIFEDLLGDYNHKNALNKTNAKQKERIIHQDNNGNTGNDISPEAIQAIFDDIFAIDDHEESERAPTIFTDDEDDDAESTQEGYDSSNTTFTMPPDPKPVNNQVDNPFDAILKDLDEKTEELAKKPSKKRKKKPKPNSKMPNPSPLSPKSSDTEIADNVEVNATVIPEDVQSAVDKWEYDAKGQRKDIITLLSTLQNALPECVVDKWKVIKLSSLLNDGAVRKGYLKGVRMVHPDKCIQRGYDEVSKLICHQIFQGLEQAWSNK